MKDVRKVLCNKWNTIVRRLRCGMGPTYHTRGYLELGESPARTTN